MKRVLLLLLVFYTMPSFGQDTIKKTSPDSLLGTWVINLRPAPDSEPYLKDFKFTKIEGKQFDGEFYGYPFIRAILKTIKFLVSPSMRTGNLCFPGKDKRKINPLFRIDKINLSRLKS